MRILKTEIEINASPERIWEILSDLDKYPDWNPFVRKFTGNLELGEKVTVTLHPPGKSEMTIKPIILKVDENKELRWLGHLIFPGIFDGEHRFTIETISKNRVLFRHEEKFSGILVPVFWKTLHHHIRVGFNEMNQALKVRSEKPL